MSRKPYTVPTVVDLGDAVKQTKGAAGRCWEIVGTAWGPPPKLEKELQQKDAQS